MRVPTKYGGTMNPITRDFQSRFPSLPSSSFHVQLELKVDRGTVDHGSTGCDIVNP